MIRFGEIEKVAIFGGSWLVAALLPKLRPLGWQAHVFTSARHLDDTINPQGETLRAALLRTETPFSVAVDINHDPDALAFAGPKTLALAVGAAWTFEPQFVQRFAGSFLDFMGIALPQYRGGAHYTWQILHGDRQGGCNLQVVYGGEETFHRGPLIGSQCYQFPENARTPQDYFEAAIAHEVAFVSQFFEDIKKGESFALQPLDESKSSFFPALNTRLNGWIDWSLCAQELERLICAFDAPYAGASTFVGSQRVFLSDCTAEAQPKFHSYTRGLVYRRNDTELFVALRDGTLRVRGLRTESGASALSSIKLGDRFHTPARVLEAALQPVVYNEKGLVSE